MKRTILATCLAGVCAVGLSAQTPTQQPPTGTSGTGSTASADQDRARGPMKVTGCLKEDGGTFTLTNVKGMGRPGGAAGTTGDTAGAPSTTGGAATTAPESGQSKGQNQIKLMAGSGVDLKPHVGHQIEVTGTPARDTAGGAGSTTTAGGTTTGGTTAGGTSTGAAGTSGRPRSLNVTDVKMIASSCSE